VGRRVAVALFAALSLPLSSAAEDPLAAAERAQVALFEAIAPAVAFLSREGALGSGFLVSPDGLLLTSRHVVEGSETIHVVLRDGRTFQGAVVERSTDTDLALVRIPVQGAPTLRLAPVADLRVGAWVGAVGHGEGAIWTYTVGMVSNIYSRGDRRPVFQTQIPINPGNSGGPIFDRRGRVVGVVTAGMKGANNINFAIHIDVALEKLSKLAEHCRCLFVQAPPAVPVFLDGKMVGFGPRVLVAPEPGAHEVFAVIQGQMKKRRLRYPEEHAVDLR
jgi:S1-C subfamily serine protease